MNQLDTNIRISLHLTILAGLLSALAFYAGATILALSGIAMICAMWSARYLNIFREYPGISSMGLILLYTVYAAWFSLLSGGFYSPGILLVFLIPLTGALTSDRKG